MSRATLRGVPLVAHPWLNLGTQLPPQGVKGGRDLGNKGRTVSFRIKGAHTSGSVNLRRDNAECAVKKAKELLDAGYWSVEIIGPDNRVFRPNEFDQLAR